MKKLLAKVIIICTLFLIQGSIFARETDNNNIYTLVNLNEKSDEINFNSAPKLWKEKANEIEDKLLNGIPTEIKDMKEYLLERDMKVDFSSNVFVITLDNGLKCVFKYDKEQEEPMVKAEVIAWKLCKETGIGNVSPVVWREIKLDNNKSFKGYLSLFVDSDIDLSNFKDDDFRDILQEVDNIEINNYRIFNFVFGNFDVADTNVSICDGKLIIIDTGAINYSWCVHYGEVPFINFRVLDNTSFKKSIKSSEFPFKRSKPADFSTREEIQSKFNYCPIKKPHNFIVYNGCYWAQYSNPYYADQIKYGIYPTELSESTKQTLKNLTYEKLFKIFETNKNNIYVNQLITGILERRDMLLEIFYKRQNII